MSSREIMEAQGFSRYDKNQLVKARKRKLKRKPKTDEKTEKKNKDVKSYYPPGTDLKELAKNLVEEYKKQQIIDRWVKSNYMSQDEYFQKAKTYKRKNTTFKKDSELW